jgi:hypothetical protein
VTDNPALSSWAARGLREVLLPSGTEVRIRLPEAATLIRTGSLPSDLLAVASRFATVGVQLEESSPEERLTFLELTRHLVADALRQVKDDAGAWVDVHLAPADLDALELPPDDLRMLELVAQRRATPEVATASSRALIAQRAAESLYNEADLERVKDDPEPDPVALVAGEEAGDTVDGWAPFRGESEGPEPGEDGGAVRAVPGDLVPAGG